MSLTKRLKDKSMEVGFQHPCICPAVTPTGVHGFLDWLERGYDGEMAYIRNRKQAYSDPNFVLDGVRSILMLGTNYFTQDAEKPNPGKGRVSNYAWGNGDYHDLIHGRMQRILDWLQLEAPRSRSRGVVDTAPLLERDYARMSGMGWIAKNTMLISPQAGSYFFLSAVLTDIELDPDDSFEKDHCGSCTACLDACPTSAFPEPYVLDATKCISYLTIEKRGAIPLELRQGIGDWLFGCDVCQEVCPWNSKRVPTDESIFQPQTELQKTASHALNLIELLQLDEQGFRQRFRKTPLWRAKRRGILRNAAIVLGNQKCAEAVPALQRGCSDDDPTIREACQWALMQISGECGAAAEADR